MIHKILLVDDDAENLNINKQLLVLAGYQITTVISGEDAIKAVNNAKKDFSLVLMDYHMPSMSGTQAIIEIKKMKPRPGHFRRVLYYLGPCKKAG